MIVKRKVGEKVHVAYSGSWSVRYTAGEVIRVTPSGICTVRIGNAIHLEQRFNPRGRCLEEFYKRNTYLDDMPFEAREKCINHEKSVKSAVELLRRVQPGSIINSKEFLLEESARLQNLLDAAKAAIDAL